MIDTHVHLQYPKYEKDRDEVLRRAAAQGVTAIIIPGTTLEDSREAVALAAHYSQATPCAAYAAVGVHPTSTDQLTADTLAELRDLAQHPRVVAIGEIGLDYYWPNQPNRRWPCAPPAQQREALAAQLALAAELGLPVILHDRDAHAHILDILRRWIYEEDGSGGTLHAYAGGIEHLKQALDMGFYIGMDGPVTFKKANTLHKVAQQVPLDRLLLETDGPYLTPHPHRGERNEPAYLSYISQRIAELRSIPTDQVESATTQNAGNLFNLDIA